MKYNKEFVFNGITFPISKKCLNINILTKASIQIVYYNNITWSKTIQYSKFKILHDNGSFN